MSDECGQSLVDRSVGVDAELEVLDLDDVFPNEDGNNNSEEWYKEYENEAEEYQFEDYEPIRDSVEYHKPFCNGNLDFLYSLPYRNDVDKSKALLQTYPPRATEHRLPEGTFSAPLFNRENHLRDSSRSTASEIIPSTTGKSYLETKRMILSGGYRRFASRNGGDRNCFERSSQRTLPPKNTLHRTVAAWRLEDDETDQNDNMSLTVDEMFHHASSQLYYTSPPKLQMSERSVSIDDKRHDKPPSGLSKLTRRLSYKDKKEKDAIVANNDKLQARLRSASVDLYTDSTDDSGKPSNKTTVIHSSPSTPAKLSSIGGSSPSTAKLNRSCSGGRLKSDYSNEFKMERRKSEKKSLYDIKDLFNAVEYQDMDLAKHILDSENLNVNSVNGEDHTPLDVAIMTNHVPMARMLITRGAKENLKYQNNRLSHLNTLVSKAEQRVTDLTNVMKKSSTTAGNTSQQNELSQWEFRHRLLKRMKAGYEHAKIPDPPAKVRLSVSSESSLLIRFSEPEDHNGAVVTRYKIEWSCYETFCPLAGEQILEDLRHLEYEIPDLTQGNVYYVRVTAWNIKGYGSPALSEPPYAVPSSWREITGVERRSEGKRKILDNLFKELRSLRPENSDINGDSPQGSPQPSRKNIMRKSWKSLFGSAFKFQKSLKRGVYLSCLMYNEDRVLVTDDNNLPIIEVDENYSTATLMSDFHWFMKIACTWDDVKSLKIDMERNSASNTLQFRSKLLQAANQLQSILCVQDLGQLYYRPIKDPNGSIVFLTINNVKDWKNVNTNSVKWTQVNKVQKKLTTTENLVCPELVTSMISEVIVFHQLSQVKMKKGLYLGYLRLIGTVELIRVLVPEKSPNVLPHLKIRDCPNVSKEEWGWLQNIGASLDDKTSPATKAQIDFQNSIVETSKKLLQKLGVDDDEAVTSRVYDIEVIELSEDVSFLLLVPPVDKVCSMYGYNEEFVQKDLLALPVQVFEMVHMSTYHNDFITRYSRLSSLLEMDIQLAQQAHRQAFSSDELTQAKDRIEKLTNLQQIQDESWRAMRWTMDVITFARDRNGKGGIPLSVLYAPPPSPTMSPLSPHKDWSTGSDHGYHSDKGSNDSVNGMNNGVSISTSTQTLPLLIKPKINIQPGVLRVYAAYDTGLAKGTSVKLHVTPRTSSREVINLVVQQLNKAVSIKGINGPIYSEDQLEDFCLVAVIGARERVLRDDYQPLQLQNPWTKGRLFVRLKDNLLAALELEHGQSTSV